MKALRTALVVDDDADSRRLLVRLLEARGWRVLEAGDGQAALDYANLARLDLVLLDLRMPGPVDGLEAAALLRQRPEFGCLPIIVVTASPQEANRNRALVAGCSAFLSKPVDLRQLWHEIERLTGEGGR